MGEPEIRLKLRAQGSHLDELPPLLATKPILEATTRCGRSGRDLEHDPMVFVRAMIGRFGPNPVQHRPKAALGLSMPSGVGQLLPNYVQIWLAAVRA